MALIFMFILCCFVSIYQIQFCLQEGRTLLHLASQNGHLSVAKALIARSFDVNSRDKVGMITIYSVFKVILAFLTEAFRLRSPHSIHGRPNSYSSTRADCSCIIS